LNSNENDNDRIGRGNPLGLRNRLRQVSYLAILALLILIVGLAISYDIKNLLIYITAGMTIIYGAKAILDIGKEKRPDQYSEKYSGD